MKDLLIKYKNRIVYRNRNIFNVNICENVFDTWNDIKKKCQDAGLKFDHFIDEFAVIDSIMDSDTTDKSKITFEMVNHNQNEILKIFEESLK